MTHHRHERFDVDSTNLHRAAWPAAEILEALDWSDVQGQLHEATKPSRRRPLVHFPIPLFLSDDLQDIYRDLKEGFLMLEAGRPEVEAVFHWRLTFWSHWGYHNSEASRLIHYYVATYLAG